MVKFVTKTPITADYTIGELIGKGAYAEVFQAYCSKTHRIRAVKRVDRKKNSNAATLLLNEFDILKGMVHMKQRFRTIRTF